MPKPPSFTDVELLVTIDYAQVTAEIGRDHYSCILSFVDHSYDGWTFEGRVTKDGEGLLVPEELFPARLAKVMQTEQELNELDWRYLPLEAPWPLTVFQSLYLTMVESAKLTDLLHTIFGPPPVRS